MVIHQIVEHQHGETAAFYLLGIGIDDVLFHMETLITDFSDTRARGYMVVPLNLGEKLGLYLSHHDGHPFPIEALADHRNVVRFRRIVELEMDGIVHVAELVHVVEADLNWHYMPETIVYLLCHTEN